MRKRFSIKDSVKGVLIAKVDPNSPAAEKRLSPGDVIVEVQQEAVATPDAVLKRIDGLKKDGKKSVLLLVANPQGDVRFVALALE
jgi:serine protease Do